MSLRAGVQEPHTPRLGLNRHPPPEYHERMSETPIPAFHVMAKPTGARCNLRCDYCFFLEKEASVSGQRLPHDATRSWRPTSRRPLEAQRVPQVTLAWQGGEPTLMGLDFFRRARAAEEGRVPAGMAVERTLQTNGVLLDDEWCAFLAENDYLVGLSIDGPRELHDAYRHDAGGRPVFDSVVRGRAPPAEARRRRSTCSARSTRPTPATRSRSTASSATSSAPATSSSSPSSRSRRRRPAAGRAPSRERSVQPDDYGRFLIAIFDEWVRRDVGEMFVQTFDGVLAAYLRGTSSLCIFQPTCGEGVALEHNGDLYSCDHFVDPAYLLGNILRDAGRRAGRAPSSNSPSGRPSRRPCPRYCRDCEYLFACNGECPKNRILLTPDGEPGLNWLCAGLKVFFAHTDRPMRLMAEHPRARRRGARGHDLLAEEARATGRNDPCPCGSGKKYKRCCGIAAG